MYNGFLLSDKSRRKLAILYPPAYGKFIGHHITNIFGIGPTDPLPEQPKDVKVIGYYNKDGLEFFTVSVDGKTDRPRGGKFHITWSIDESKGVKPVHSNNYVNEATPIHEVSIDVSPFKD